ncbi:MAG: S-layer homology domain-containing protein [Faecousia sp.]
MKRRILALLLALTMLLGMTATVMAADEATLALIADYEGGKVVVTVSAQNAAGLTNGQVKITYDAENLKLETVKAADSCPLSSVNEKTAGTVTMAWAGSKLTAEDTKLLTLVFIVKSVSAAAEVKASATQAYASGTKMTLSDAAVTVLVNPFTDIGGHWAESNILSAYHAGLFNGISATEFGPELSMTRAMFVTVLYRMEGAPSVDMTKLHYSDVSQDSYYAAAVVWAEQAGVANGVGGNRFSPETDITRQEMVTMFYRFANYKGQDVTATTSLSRFKDADKVADWALAAMQWAVADGLIGGHTDWTIGPEENATRAQAATVFCRYAGLS